MKCNFSILFITVATFMFVSCNSELNEGVIFEPEMQEGQTLEEQPSCILSFDNEEAFLEALEEVRTSEYINYSPRVRSALKGKSYSSFKSIFDEYNQAMEEADEYYLRPGGYEEFKSKFPNLYYPEYKGDYSAYLPVSDEAIAKIVNIEGKVLIGGVEKNLKNISSYSKLQELQLAIPDIDNFEDNNLEDNHLEDINPEDNNTAVTPPSSSTPVNLTVSKQRINKKRKAWITNRGGIKTKDGRTLARIDVCFRKKGWIGWYNGKITSEASIGNRQKRIYLGEKRKEYSPHKYVVLEATNNETLEILKNTKVSPIEFKVLFDRSNKYGFVGVYQADMNKLAKLENGLGFIENWGNWYAVQLIQEFVAELGGKALYLGVLFLIML